MLMKRALLISTLSEVINRVLSLVSVALFARLLTPDELGVFIIASSIMFVASEIRMIGTHTYIVREKEINASKISSAIGLAIIMSWGLAAVLSGLAPVMANFYDNPDLVMLILFLSVGFYATPFTSNTSALLSRELKFGSLFILQLFGPIVGLIVAVIMLMNGASYEALAIGQAVQAICDLLVARLIKPSHMSWKPNLHHVRDILKVGVYTSLINLTNKLSEVVPDLILGKLSASSFVAIVSRAIGLQIFMRDLLLSGVSKIALPYMALQTRQNGDLKAHFLKTTDIALVFVIPPILAGSIASATLIDLIFGDQWVQAVPLAQMLGIWMLIRCLHYFAQPVLLAVSAEAELFWYKLAGLVTLSVLIILNAKHGVAGIGGAFIAAASLEFIFFTILLKQHIGLGLWEFLSKVKLSLGIAFVLAACAYATRELLVAGLPSILQVLVYFVMLFPTWVTLVVITNHPIREHLPLKFLQKRT